MMVIRIGIVAVSTTFALVASPARASTAIGSWQQNGLYDETAPLTKGKRPFAPSGCVVSTQPHNKRALPYVLDLTPQPVNEPAYEVGKQDPTGELITPSSDLFAQLKLLCLDDDN